MMKTCICAIAKDEDHYFKEWLDYNTLIGFDDIFVFQNDWVYKGDVPSNLHLYNISGPAQQMTAYNSFIKMHHRDYSWCAFIDIDEFIFLKEHKNIKEFLSGYSDVNGVFLNWRQMGDSNIKFDWKNYSVIDRFTTGGSKLESCGKTILNFDVCGNTLQMFNPHIPNVATVDPSRKYSTNNGNIYKNAEEYEPVELYHYRNKTFTENFLRRYNTQDVFWDNSSQHNMHMLSYEKFTIEFDKMNTNEVKLDGLMNFVRGSRND